MSNDAMVFERFILAEDRQRTWTNLSPAERARLWLDEIEIDIPTIWIWADDDFYQGSYGVQLTVSWKWDVTRRFERPSPNDLRAAREFDARNHAVSQMLGDRLFEDQDANFARFELLIHFMIRKLLLDASKKLTTTRHETLDEYIAKRTRKVPR